MIHPHSLLILVSLAILVFFLATGVGVARVRRLHGLHAPAMTGHDQVERAIRVQANTLEWLPLILLTMWFFYVYFGQVIPAVLGVVWIIGRIIYWAGYMRSPKNRELGFFIQGFPVLILLLGSIFGAARAFLALGG